MNDDSPRSDNEPGSVEETGVESEDTTDAPDEELVENEPGVDEDGTTGGDKEAAEDGADSGDAETADEADDATEPEDDAKRELTRRVAAIVIGLVVGIVPFFSGVVFFLDPLLRKKNTDNEKPSAGGSGVVKDGDGFLRLAVTREGLPDDGTPQMVTVQDDLVDAWNKFRNVPIGTIWLRKIDGAVTAFNTICPHLGCTVEFRGAERDFYCPCHLSAFELNGEKKNPIPPRDMDSLELKADTGDEIWVRFKNYRGGLTEKLEI